MSNARILNLLNQLKIINNPQHWRVLIESFIRSITVLNFVPILAIDKKARMWSEKRTNDTIKFIFDWPANTPKKTIRLILDIPPVKITLT